MDSIYKKMYLTLFQAISSALKAMEEQNFGMAKDFLLQGHRDAEEIFMDGEETEINP